MMKKDLKDVKQLIKIDDLSQLFISERSSSFIIQASSFKNNNSRTCMKNVRSTNISTSRIIDLDTRIKIQIFINNSHLHTRMKNIESLEDVIKIKFERIRSSKSCLLNQIDELSETRNISLKITDIFEKLNLVDKIENAKQKTKEKSKSSSFRSIKTIDIDSINIIENKRARKSNSKYAQLA